MRGFSLKPVYSIDMYDRDLGSQCLSTCEESTRYATLIVEILKDNARPEAGEVYGAMDMGWAKLVGQIAQAYKK